MNSDHSERNRHDNVGSRTFSDSKHYSPYAKKYDPIAVASIDGTPIAPHDNAVVRALNSEYIPNSKLPGSPERTLFVGRLHPKVKEDELIEIFAEYGKIKRCRVVRDIVTGHSKQYAFVEFEKDHHCDRAYRHGHKRIVRGAEILVDREFGRTMPGWRPRSLGGGFGGKKESGQLRFGCRERPWLKPIGLLPSSSSRERSKGHTR